MDFDDQIDLEHLLFTERKCRVCGKTKDLINDFYLTHKERKGYPSSYSYECKQCTIKRIIRDRCTKKSKIKSKWEYPDW